MKNIKKFTKWFTLVELIIVITILAILATIAFISFQGFTKNARDGNRVSTIKNIENWLELYTIKTGNYPTPEWIFWTGYIDANNLVYVGTVWEWITRQIKMNTIPLDPLTWDNYVYGISSDNKYYQIATIQENLQANIINMIPNTYVNTTYQAYVSWNYDNLLTYGSGSLTCISNIPSLIFNTGWLVDLTDENIWYVLNKERNLPYTYQNISNSIIPTPQILQSISSTGAIWTICDTSLRTKEIFLDKSWELEDHLWYPIDKIWLKIFWDKYFTEIKQNWNIEQFSCEITQEKINKFWELCLKYDDSYTNMQECIDYLGFNPATWEVLNFPTNLLVDATQEELEVFNIFKRVDTKVYIYDTNNIKNLTLPCLEYVKEFRVYNNPSLETIDMLNIDTEAVRIYENPLLEELIIAKNAEIMKEIWIYDNLNLLTIDWFNSLKDLTARGAFWIYNNPKLENLPNFDNLKRVSWLITMYGMDMLSNLPTFPSLEEIYLDSFGRNDIDLSDLPNITNDKLSVFDWLSVGDLLLNGTTPADCTQSYITITGTCSD